MIPEFLQDLILSVAEGKVFSTDNGVYIVAESPEAAHGKILEACGEPVYELLSVTPVKSN